MTRRNLLQTSAAAGIAGGLQAADDARQILELTTYRLRNSLKNERSLLTEFFEKSLTPALDRAGVPASGFFSSFVAPDGPFLLSVTAHPSLAAWDSSRQKLASDQSHRRALEGFSRGIAQSPVRVDKSLLRSFSSVPSIIVPPASKDGARLFELRTYESNTPISLAAKIKMFDDGEVAIFKRVGITPVFFGETIVGTNMPSLTYLVQYDDWQARDKAWGAFLADPEWLKLRATPGVSDAEAVSNISNVLLRGLPFSKIR